MNAYSYVVGPQDAAWTTLFDMAASIGFAGISSFRGMEQVAQQAEETPICYFLFSAVADIASLRAAAAAIRFSPYPNIRFSPMVYCAEDPAIETIIACINMGFDDIVALPQPVFRLRERLARQLDRTMVFYETPDYFGPDRRNRVADRGQPRPPARRPGPFRRLEVVRNLLDGVLILHDELSSPPADVAALQSLQQSA